MAAELYLITPPRLPDVAAFCEDLGGALDAGPVACVQLRLKETPDDEILRAADAILPVCHARGVPLLMNDRPDLGVKSGCDGCHVGQDDTPYAEARRLMGAGAQIGVTCKASRHLAMEAGEAGADYVAFGAFFPSGTKAVTTPAPVDLLAWWSQVMTVPSVAIGGITAENCGPLVEAGADFLAVIGAVWGHPDGPAAGVKAFETVLEAS
jgi:thiamine-phosphate pyrophosphorylase